MKTNDELTSGLALSVGEAPAALRVLIAIVLLATAAALFWASVLLAEESIAEAIISAIVLTPAGVMAVVTAIFAMAPRSRFGRWLDRGAAPAPRLIALGWAVGLAVAVLCRL